MYLRLCYVLLLVLAGCALCGCFPNAEGQTDEQKNEYFIQGKERAAARDFPGAIESFEKAVQINPRSARAHFELGVLYEKNGDQKDDFVVAMYHYLQAVKLRPNDYPAENARQRIQACKQELIKTETLAPVAQGLLRDLDRLKQENQNLQKQLETAKAQLAAKPPVPAPTPRNTSLQLPTGLGGSSSSNIPGTGRNIGGRITPLPPVSGVRTHTVKDRDSLFSIARQYGVKLDALVAANPALNPKKIKVGQVVNVPGGVTGENR
jgi:LysM repeat protein